MKLFAAALKLTFEVSNLRISCQDFQGHEAALDFRFVSFGFEILQFLLDLAC